MITRQALTAAACLLFLAPALAETTTGEEERAGLDWWALQPLSEVDPPDSGPSDWIRNDVDRFILDRLKAAGISPSPQASPRSQVRRLYFDLIGLPPPPEVIRKFEADPSDDAYDRLVAELLNSPHYGERWGRHWLDVVRFGESDGFERNHPRRNAWPYRDWVIEALNQDMPYDEFVRFQIAGDLMKPDVAGAAAAGFLVAGVHNTVVGGSERMKRLARQDELEEIAGVVGQTFLGLTVNCARCHDHKYDPIRTEEYYSFIALLDGISHGERDVPNPVDPQKLQRLREEVASLQTELDRINTAAHKAILASRKKREDTSAAPDTPRPMAAWDFEADLKDRIGGLHGTAHGNARVVNGMLVLDGSNDYVTTEPLKKDLTAKTLEAWVLLDTLDQKGGAAISVESPDGTQFDAIVFAERDSRQWMAGSDGFRRTKSFNAPQETVADKQPVHFAIVYEPDGTITGYRNGVPYGKPYKTGIQSFKARNSHVAFGMRHLPPGKGRMLKGGILRANLYDQALSSDAVAAAAGLESDFISDKAIAKHLGPEKDKQRSELRQRLQQHRNEIEQLENSGKRKIYTIRPRNPGTMRLHVRGSVTDFGDEMAPAAPSALRTVNGDFGLSRNAPDKDRRLRLAEWIAHPRNALFTRVAVNRVWHHHFGQGIVDTPNDFGFNGGRPSHPELLDWLAGWFQENDYRLKPLHRLLVTSAAYRQQSRFNAASSKQDAGNRLLWRKDPTRLEAEVLRDSILEVAGRLNRQAGGPGFVDVTIKENNGTTYYAPFDREDASLDRRTIYRFSPRGGRSTLLDTFDCPDPSSTAPRRAVTTTPLQALSLLNNAFVLRMTGHFSQRVLSSNPKSHADAADQVFQLALGRLPDPEERQRAARLVGQHGLQALCRALFNSNEFVVIE